MVNSTTTKDITLLYLCLLTLSCTYSSDSNEDTRVLDALLDRHKQEIVYSAYLIVPMNGCSGCKMKAVDFIKSYYNELDVCYILFNGAYDSKILKQTFTGELLNTTNILISSERELRTAGVIIDEFPLLLECNNGIVVNTTTLSTPIIDQELAAMRIKYRK